MKTSKYPYLQPGRLADVMALIQVLALSPLTRRSEEGLQKELQNLPSSGGSWIEIASQHREFFKVKPAGKKRSHVSLVARNVQAPEPVEDGALDIKFPLLPLETTTRLLEFAVSLHTREASRKDAVKTIWFPVGIAILAGIGSIAAAYVGAKYRTDSENKIRQEYATPASPSTSTRPCGSLLAWIQWLI